MAGAPGAASRDELVKKVAALTAINAALQSENEQVWLVSRLCLTRAHWAH